MRNARAALGVLGLWVAACSGDAQQAEGGGFPSGGSSGSGGGAAASSGGSSGSSATGGSGGTLSSCNSDAECASGQRCSVAGTCLQPGTCAAAGDCQTGEACNAGHLCVPAGSCAVDADCDAAQGLTCDEATSRCVPGGGCGAQEFSIEGVPPNVLVVLDRSCSMRNKVGGVSKWQIAVDALNQLTTNHAGKIRWGLTLFPDIGGDQCTQDAVPIQPGAGTEAQIQTLLTSSLQTADAYYPNGPCVTNIDTAMAQAAAEPTLTDSARENFALLITDGKQAGCSDAGGDPGTEGILASMAAAGVRTFVVGFGGETDPAQMNRFADAGGIPKNDPTTRYYQADDAATLVAELGVIASSVVGCSFSLGSAPPDLSKLFVFFDDAGIPRDTTHQSGWDYDAATNQITFYGAQCDALKANQISDVDVVFGCNEPIPG